MRITFDSTPIPWEPVSNPADEGFTQIEFPPTYSDFASARRRFLDQISMSARDDTLDPGSPRVATD